MIHLGKCLAHVQSGSDLGGPSRIQGEVALARDTVETVKGRLDFLNSSDRNDLSGIAVPDRSCLVDRPFLDGNVDFFLLYFGISRLAQTGCINCVKLMKHLNDCYRCFDAYCSTLQEYFLEKERLARKARD